MTKKIIFVIIGALLILLVMFGIKLLIKKPKIEGHEYFNLTPETWIEDIDYTPEPEDIEINLFKATRGNAMVVDNIQEDYNLEGELISFFYRGSYKGIPFKTVYLADEFYNVSEGKTIPQQEQLAEQYVLMRISPQMDPTDGVINSFILAKIENDRFVFYIFLDEDWKNKLQYTNILWGDDFTDPNTLHIRPFNFQNSTKGIYIDKLTYDVDWFESAPIAGGIAVGEINQPILNKILSEEEITETFIYVR